MTYPIHELLDATRLDLKDLSVSILIHCDARDYERLKDALYKLEEAYTNLERGLAQTN